MAFGITSFKDVNLVNDCDECDLDEQCCTESCEARLFVGPCGQIDYQTGELKPEANFWEPRGSYLIGGVSNNTPVREKSRQGCTKFRIAGQPDYSFDVTWDICQSDPANGVLLGKCNFDAVIIPICNNVNFELNPSIWDQRTKVFWGRFQGDTYNWEFPEDECQTTSRTFSQSGYFYQTDIEALIPTADELVAA